MTARKILRQALGIVLPDDRQARINLFEAFPPLKRFFADRRYFAAVRTFGDIVFTVIILVGFFGPQDPDRNAILFMVWGVWWTTIVLSWFFTGRLWCGFCPFPGVGRILRRFGMRFNADVPRFLQKNGVYLSTFFLAVILWAESVFNLKESPSGTAILLVAIIAGATLMEVLFKGQAWCRHVCPMGRIIGSAATISITEFRPDLAVCKTCKTASCRKGTAGGAGCPVYLGAVNVRNNLDCLVCGHCVPMCPYDSPRINLRNPFAELVINKGRYLTCSFIIPFLMGSQLARFIYEKAWFVPLKTYFHQSDLVAFTVLLGAGFLFFLGLIRVGARLFTVTEDEVFGRFSPMVPVLVPFTFTGELVYRLAYFLSEAGSFFPTLGSQAGMDLSRWRFVVDERFIGILSLLILAVGAAASHNVLRLFHKGDFEGMIPRRNYAFLHVMVVAILIVYAALSQST